MTNYLEREHKPFIRLHINKFPSLNNLKELNHWVYTLAKKEAIANRIVFKRYFLGLDINKKVLSPVREGTRTEPFARLKNEKFDLEPFALNYIL